jgi:hypothetical protein
VLEGICEGIAISVGGSGECDGWCAVGRQGRILPGGGVGCIGVDCEVPLHVAHGGSIPIQRWTR